MRQSDEKKDQSIHLILLSGGSGKRLWPLSNDVRSKQFLKLLKDDQGGRESMVQRVYRQIRAEDGWASITIAAGAGQEDLLKMQIGSDVTIVTEPDRRDTFPAIALACSYIYSHQGAKKEDVVVVLPADPFVEADFFRKIKEIPRAMESSSQVVLLGVKPTTPTEKYGYILPEERSAECKKVRCFKEKPNQEEAQELIDSGALWNCGVFGMRLGYMMDLLTHNYDIDFEYEEVYRRFDELKKTSFDYAVVEKAESVVVIPYTGTWKDLGTWQTVTEEMKIPAEGNVIGAESCKNTHVVNDLDLPIVVMGLEDAVVVASGDGILVANKDATVKLKEAISGLNGRPRYERRRWGKYRVLEQTEGSLTKKLIIEAGKGISYQYHRKRKEFWTVTGGEGVVYLDGEKRSVFPGDCIQIPVGVKHGIKAVTELHVVEVQLGEELVEEDIMRLEMEW